VSRLTTNPTAVADRRARLVTEAVVSAYINEIGHPPRDARRAAPRPTCATSSSAGALTRLGARSWTRRRQHATGALKLAAPRVAGACG
jgi:hypothetical protein